MIEPLCQHTFLKLLDSVEKVRLTKLGGLAGLLIKGEQDQKSKVLIDEREDILEQAITFVHELLHIRMGDSNLLSRHGMAENDYQDYEESLDGEAEMFVNENLGLVSLVMMGFLSQEQSFQPAIAIYM